MRQSVPGIVLSASDLSTHLACRHCTQLDLAVLRGQLDAPTYRDPALEVLQERGFRHEAAYLDHLGSEGLQIVQAAEDEADHVGVERTAALMKEGADVIVQAVLSSGWWMGRADVLLKVPVPSDLGDWSYEVVDTKLARETKGGTILQLCLYSDIVQDLQGRMPDHMHVVSPGRGYAPESFRTHDYLAYYRYVQRCLVEAVAVGERDDATYPEPVEHCQICRWWQVCDRRRRVDDHLSLVAGISTLQRRELESWGVSTLERLARLPLPLQRRPSRGSTQALVRAREQARIQYEGRVQERPLHELLPREPEHGLAKLPEPSLGDVFLDLEGDPFAGDGGLEYLFGCVTLEDSDSRYQAQWAFRPSEERASFEWFVDLVCERWERYPDLHIYHYAPYEPAALRRLMGRYATREEEVDRMLRAGLFVDLYAVVRHSLRASVERYSIKDLEIFYEYERTAPLREASHHLHAVEWALELDTVEKLSPDTLRLVQAYNQDDCVSALRLRDWLERLRRGLVDAGEPIPRPVISDGEASEVADDRRERVQALKMAVAGDVPVDPSERTDEEHARWLLAEMLEWHRREEKAVWWEYFRLRELPPEELLFERAALSGLTFVERLPGGTAKCPIDRYSFPHQDADIRTEADLHSADGAFGRVVQIDTLAGIVDIKKRSAAKDVHPEAVFECTIVPSKVLAASLFRLAEWVNANGIEDGSAHRAARSLLLARPPFHGRHTDLRRPDEEPLAAARRLVLDLDGDVLPIQGPPGSGKTYAGARMICDLVRAGKKVGITAVSHKVIRNLLDGVVEAAAEDGLELLCAQKIKGEPDGTYTEILEFDDNAAVLACLSSGQAQVAAGTAWLWAREDFAETVDVLFVDEAGQMSLANAVAVAQAAKNLVLLGDPQQLEQPQQGSHPMGTEVSALEHLLAGHETIPDDRGLFLDQTWRLHPAICAFTSEVFYEGRLEARPELENQAVLGKPPFEGAGLWFLPVEHTGNQNSSPEEVESVHRLVRSLVSTATWVDTVGSARRLGADDVLVVCPYNAQVADMSERLSDGRVGTVDKFQGQEAPLVVYSMATSSPEEAPRGMEFLYSLNRLNVATSRARAVCILVACPNLFEVDCRTPNQMRLANAFCRYLEMAARVV